MMAGWRRLNSAASSRRPAASSLTGHSITRRLHRVMKVDNSHTVMSA
jgi:hypothetical protein